MINFSDIRDDEFEAYTLDAVRPLDDGWELSFDDGLGIFVSSDHEKTAPRVGEVVTLYGRGFGYPVRGIAIAGRVYRYETRDEYDARFQRELEDKRAARAAAADSERPERDARIAKLPEPLRQRIQRFQRTRKDWCAEHEPYELFVCEEAAEMARLFPSLRELEAFSKLEYGAQAEAAPSLRLNEHSGNTFGASKMLAHFLITNPDLAPHAHGALCPLVGCQDYGCYAAYEAKTEAQP